MKNFYLILSCIVLVLSASCAYAQKELWAGVNPSIATTPPFYPNAAYPNGAIVKTDSVGNVISYVHIFDTLHGRFCNSQLLQASNEKIYGTTSSGGTANAGTLFEYDPVIDSYRVLVNFGDLSIASPPNNGLIEGLPGILYATAGYGDGGAGTCIYAYNIIAGTMSLVATVPGFTYGLTTYQNYVHGPLYKASNGNIYGTTGIYSSCPSSAPGIGAVFKFNPATNVFSYVYPFNCTFADGAGPNGGFVELGGKLYSNTLFGGIYGSSGQGVIFAYDLAANSYTKMKDFSDTTGVQPQSSFIKATNNKFYGYVSLGFDSVSAYTYTLYEYAPLTDSYKRKFGFHNPIGIPNDVGTGPTNKPFQASNGKLYGATERGVFEYDIPTDSMRHAADLLSCSWQQFTEICRKPAHRYYSNVYDTACQGASFAFDLHCSNAQTFVWRHNGSIDLSQTTGILSFTAAAVADSGTWQCTLNNECGSTLPPPIHIAVKTLPVAGIVSGADTVCIGSSITLLGTVSGGAWSVAASSVATITASGVLSGIASGVAIITYTVGNSCGTDYDTASITVLPATGSAGVITGLPSVCTGDTIVLSNAVAGGIWSIAATGLATINSAGRLIGITAGNAVVSYTVTNTCGSAYDTMLVVVNPSVVNAGIITGMSSVCVGDTVMLSNTIPGGIWQATNAMATVSGGIVTGIIAGIDTIQYTITTSCGSGSAASIITINPLPVAGSIAGKDTLCPGDTTLLAPTVGGGIWGSSNNAVATIAATGIVTAVAEGNAIVSYTVTNACGSATAVMPFSVRSAATCNTGIAEEELHAGLEIFPNPNAGMFTVLLHSPGSEAVRITISDVLGRKIKEVSIPSNSLTQIDLDEPAGIYQLVAISTTGRYVVKLAVVK